MWSYAVISNTDLQQRLPFHDILMRFRDIRDQFSGEQGVPNFLRNSINMGHRQKYGKVRWLTIDQATLMIKRRKTRKEKKERKKEVETLSKQVSK